MKAVLLAAGFGTRLRPITDSIPKCLVPIGDKPLLGHWLDSLFEAGIDSVLINLHYRSDQVRKYVATRVDKDKLFLAEESELLGTAGTIRENRTYLDGDQSLIIHADNFCNANLTDFIQAHYSRPKNTDLTMMTFVSDQPSQCGIVETDKLGVVTAFHEKVEDPPSNLANGAVYVFEPSVIDFICSTPVGEIRDISNDVLPRFLGKINTWPVNDFFIDIGTPSNLEKARRVLDQKNH
ncbi:nucleotidyltransferase family protein [Arenicellales bacterium IMCC57338]